MYNEELKMKFIREEITTASSAAGCKATFEAVAPYEEKWGADICTKGAEELSPILEELVGMRSRSRFGRMIELKKYAQWCVKQRYPGAVDGISEIDSVGLGKMKYMMVSNPTHLQLCMDEMFEPESQNTIDNTYRCYLWMAYSGLQEEDIIKVRNRDIDYEYMEIHYNGCDYPIYRESLRAFRSCTSSSEFVYKHPNYTKNIVRSRIPGDIVVRGIKADPLTLQFRSELSKKYRKMLAAGKEVTHLSYNRVWLSGMFHRMKVREDAGVPVDFGYAADEFLKGRTYYYSDGRNVVTGKRNQIIKDYVVDYERWKSAFFSK